ncbi:MAG TPA: ROK family transcriptional regulator [Devosia sp.]|jgi:predicted NBD/HSP70 family sugar kinase|nr:ROK family transcriptional regulator [Devosia sp.]
MVDKENAKSFFATVARGVQPASVRQSNQRAILTVISLEPGCSNADIARRTGLAPQTVSAVLDDLESVGLLKRGAARRGGGRGQPATPIYINPDGAYAIGAEIGWERIEVSLTDFTGRVVERQRRNYAYPDATTVFDDLAQMVGAAAASLPAGARRRLVGLGLASPGGIGDTSSLVAPPPGQAELWAKIDIAAEATRATGLDVQHVNDGNAACWAEFVAHQSPRPGNFMFLLIDTFVAAGIVAEHRLWQGATGASANLGSMLVADRRGTSRFVHQVASKFALRGRLESSRLTLADALEDTREPEAQFILSEWIEDAAFALAQTILNTATVIEFDFAVIDAELPQPILGRIIDAVSRKLLDVPTLGRLRPEVRLGHLGRGGAAQGAAQLRIYRRHYSRDLVDMELY